VLCPRFAVIRGGRLLAVTTPALARADLAGTIFEGDVEPDAFEPLKQQRCVTQSYLFEGRNRARVYEPDDVPPPGFVAVAPTLEDVYLVLMRGRLPRFARASSAEDAVVTGGAR